MANDDKNKIFNLARLRFDELYNDAVSNLEKIYSDVKSYLTNASPFGQILNTTLNLSKLIFYYIEDSITELNILKATREENIKGLATLVGHNPTRSNTATGELKLTYNGNFIDIYGNTIIIPNYTRVLSKTNGLKYTILLNDVDIRMELTKNNFINIKVVQGEFEYQEFTSDGTKLQSFNVSVRGNKNIDNFYINVFVNNEKWKVYDSLYDIPYQGKGCVVKTSITGNGISVFFGNENFGLIPPIGSIIRVEYLVTNGQFGNILFKDQDEGWSFIDNGFDLTGEDVDLNSILNVSIEKEINFGTPPEPLFLTRLIAPKTSRNFVLANTENYIIFLEKFNFFSIIDAYTLEEDSNIIYLFLVPDVNKRLKGTDNYFTIPIEYFLLTPDEKNKIYQLIEESKQRMITAVNVIAEPKIKKYVLNISLIIYENYDKNILRQRIIDKLSIYFLNNRRRDRIPKSDIISIIESIPGVDSVNCWFVSEENELDKKLNPNSKELKGLDEFGDIIINKDELPVVRGGFYDRNNIYYEDSIDPTKPGSVNIIIKKVIPYTFNVEKQNLNKENLKTN